MLDGSGLHIQKLHEILVSWWVFHRVEFCPLGLDSIELVFLGFKLVFDIDQLFYSLLLLQFDIVDVGLQYFPIQLRLHREQLI